MINTLAILNGNTLSIIIVVILLFNLPYGFTRERIQRKIFALFGGLIIAGALFGIGSAIFDGVPGLVPGIMVRICGTAGIVLPVLFGFNFWLYVETAFVVDIREIKTKIYLAVIPLAIVFFLFFINVSNHMVFYVTSDNIYHRGSLGLVAYILSPTYLVVSLFRIAYIKSHKQGFLFVPILGVIFPIIVVSAIQMKFYGIIQSWMGFSIGMISLYIGMQKDLLYSDSMTGVFNRIYLDYTLNEAIQKKQTLGGVMIDIDHFKSINDTLGHNVGDIVIKKAAAILKGTSSLGTNVIRVGGDEFLVIHPTDNEEDLELLKECIREKCKEESKTMNLGVDIEFSMGSGIFVPGDMPESEWLSHMDKNMYAEKALHRRERRNRRASDGSSL